MFVILRSAAGCQTQPTVLSHYLVSSHVFIHSLISKGFRCYINVYSQSQPLWVKHIFFLLSLLLGFIFQRKLAASLHRRYVKVCCSFLWLVALFLATRRSQMFVRWIERNPRCFGFNCITWRFTFRCIVLLAICLKRSSKFLQLSTHQFLGLNKPQKCSWFSHWRHESHCESAATEPVLWHQTNVILML